MNIDIRMGTKRESPALRQFAEHSLIRKLGTRATRIQRASIRLNDLNGPRGGIDKRCRVLLDVPGGGTINAIGEASGWYEAVTIAVMNVRATLDRRLGRIRTRKAQGRSESDFLEAEVFAPRGVRS